MKCTSVNKNLIAFIDSELESEKRLAIQEHLQGCRSCRENYLSLKKLYQPAAEIDSVESSNFLWEKLYQRINEQQKIKIFDFNFVELLPRFATALLVILLFLGAIGLGVFLGSLDEASHSLNQATLVPTDELTKETYLDAFDTIPPESVAGVYFSLRSEEIK